MGFKHKTIINDFPNMLRQTRLVNGNSVEVGVLQGESKWLASIHEYGCDIPVTPKMRAYLHRQGLHLKASTTRIKIPERSFLRSGYDQNRDAVIKKASLMMADVVGGQMSVHSLCKGVGLELSSKIKDYARDLDSPPNHPFTTEQKGSSNPLVDTGDMIGGITWRKAK